ncbi:MAG: hypothetical protein ACFE8M_09980 [Candidatus Hermodarchaeota archaeon]
MKNNKKTNRKIYLLIILLTGLALGSCTIAVKANISDFTFNIEEFKGEIQNSDDLCWKNPGQNRKDAICKKLTALQELINEENFEEAYDKLLYDIKPKLTGLKTDENEVPWGNGVFEQTWVICENLREEFRVECNLILSEINPLAVYDDDKTPPDILIIYEGGYYVYDPGIWHVDIEDIESGLDEVKIEVNGIVEIHDTDLLGVLSLSYDIPVPAIVGFNTIVVIATNNDKDFIGDQETSTETEWVEIKVPPINIINPEEKEYAEGNGWYFGTYDFESDPVGGDPAGWQVNDFYASEIDIFEEPSPHQKVIRIADNEDDWVCETYTYFGGDKTSGTVEWWVMSSDINSRLKMELMSSWGYRFDVRIWGDQIRAGTFSQPFNIDTWYHIRVDFDCVTHTYDVSINGELKASNLPFDDIISSVFCFRLQTDFYTFSGPYYFDALGYSWDDDYNTGDNYKRGLLLSFDTKLDLDWIGYSLDGQPSKTILGNTTIPMPDLGSHTIQVFGEDSLGNAYESDIRNFYIIDQTPPTSSINYYGEGHAGDPGDFAVNVEDLESGLYKVNINLFDANGDIVDTLEELLGGIETKSYVIPLPAIVGTYTIVVIATNDDPTGRDTSTSSGSVGIVEEPGPIEPPPIIPL